ncbi:MAG: peptidase S41, partial [Muribaculaceae bacterium]|nr:peptidase S41 [Muribaculaceae bacterium]
PQVSPLLYGLVTGNHIFDYANRYVANHPAPASVTEFTISDEEFADFAAGIDSKNLQYDKLCNSILDDLRTTAKAEGYLTPEIQAAIDSLDRQLDHDLRSDLYTKRDRIEEMLTEEIAARYEPGSGRPRRELLNDPALDKAEEIFTTPGLYEKILNLQQSAAGKN